MIVHEEARRGQILSAARPATRGSSRSRLAGRRVEDRDDKGRQVMPFDLFVDEHGCGTDRLPGVADLMLETFGGRAWT